MYKKKVANATAAYCLLMKLFHTSLYVIGYWVALFGIYVQKYSKGHCMDNLVQRGQGKWDSPTYVHYRLLRHLCFSRRHE
jgi:hypothetical protein